MWATFHNVTDGNIKINTTKSGLFLKKSNFTRKMIPKNPGIAKNDTQKSGSNPQKVPKIMAHPHITTYASPPPPPRSDHLLSWLKSAWASRYTLSRLVKLSWTHSSLFHYGQLSLMNIIRYFYTCTVLKLTIMIFVHFPSYLTKLLPNYVFLDCIVHKEFRKIDIK